MKLAELVDWTPTAVLKTSVLFALAKQATLEIPWVAADMSVRATTIVLEILRALTSSVRTHVLVPVERWLTAR